MFTFALAKNTHFFEQPKRGVPKWMEKLQIIVFISITLCSNIIFKGAGRNPKTGKKKGGIKSRNMRFFEQKIIVRL